MYFTKKNNNNNLSSILNIDQSPNFNLKWMKILMETTIYLDKSLSKALRIRIAHNLKLDNTSLASKHQIKPRKFRFMDSKI